ncbi:50S ribosomal subunit protein L13 [Desulfamplus magnetovallimortis]|uniref:Large ribosomal subunit protein uL13 n=1 Tax=Desulfamplus magnetovallimortis TaxID=1246637 RepID=A0A1W1HKD2_9BACT|nr:50S ribosomal protein L13 [Desulfamplus magnetovallimortis]SLM32951.1 50S ribosomal subunit protein L13 [Desulfamplus magnetovallimortis]
MKKYTYSAKRSDNKENWCVIDAKDKVLGRVASEVAARIRGKHNPLFTPHVDTGDWVIVLNADKVKLTGNKWTQKTYYRHTGYMGGIRATTAKELLEKKPEELVKKAVRGMLPKNRLGRKLNTKLFVYAGEDHPHAAQKPEVVKI